MIAGWDLVEDKQITSSIGHDSYVKLCSHFDGADAATAYTDPIGGAATFGGNAQLDTAQKKFGSASLLLDGNGDYITYGDSSNWTLGTSNFTIDTWVRASAFGAGNGNSIISHYTAANYWTLRIGDSGANLTWAHSISSGAEVTVSASFAFSTNTWYHIAVTRSGTKLYLFVDGTLLNTGGTDYNYNLPDIGAVLEIGSIATAAYFWNGWLDELRISNGIARWTAGFTAPTVAHGCTSYTFSGLTGDTAEDYRLVAYVVSTAPDGFVFIRPNNDSTATNYGFQRLQGQNATASATRDTSEAQVRVGTAGTTGLSFSDTTIKAKSGVVRTFLTKAASYISGTTIGDMTCYGQSWNDTANEITSLVVGNTVTDGIGAGSRIILLKKRTAAGGCWMQVSSQTLESAATSVTISSLTGNTDILYNLVVRLVGGANSTTVSVRPNNDTGTNYGYQLLSGSNTSPYAERGTASSLLRAGVTNSAGQIAFSDALIYAPSGYVRTAIFNNTLSIATTTVDQVEMLGDSWNNTADEITSLVIVASQTNGLGIGTVIELWKYVPPIAYTQSCTETVDVTSTAPKGFGLHSLDESSTATDAYSRVWDMAHTFSDSVTGTDLPRRALVRALSAESVTITDKLQEWLKPRSTTTTWTASAGTSNSWTLVSPSSKTWMNVGT